MPKKPRQAHVQQRPKRRKARRAGAPITDGRSGSVTAPREAPEAEVPVSGPAPAPPQLRPRRRLELVRAPQEAASVRILPGQLPTFERSYLVRELRQIGLTAGGLLALIIVLTLILR